MKYIKKIPKEVLNFFKLNFPKSKYFFYTYQAEGEKIYGCDVCRGTIKTKVKKAEWRRFKTRKTPALWHNATQGNLQWYKENQQNKIYT